ncbi:lipoprotein [Streptomyces lincolnensis]|uniref:Lipoprotein n=1 Tax=Streptomyces lincolnensis TaxID=1915 RepID=A0A1B1M4C7_STRLN|nr:lipoprotein [Streptomyces lincolnensis]AXG52417.1 lipoprotein [Streptomyces lincolnensis]
MIKTAALACLLTVLAGCGGPGPTKRNGTDTATAGQPASTAPTAPATTDPTRIPGLGDRWQRRIPADSRQVLAVYGESRNSARSTVALYTKQGSTRESTWDRTRAWPAHNGRKGWTPDHREGDKRSPVGVFTLSDAGGVLPDPGARLPYTRSAAFAAPRWWAKSYWHDFDYVIAIDYNRVKGTPPNDQTRPGGYAKGGGIWLHMDHGSGTSACVSLSRPAMRYLLRTLDPDRHPVVVMGDRADLKS